MGGSVGGSRKGRVEGEIAPRLPEGVGAVGLVCSDEAARQGEHERGLKYLREGAEEGDGDL